jgi:hypothetical protein
MTGAMWTHQPEPLLVVTKAPRADRDLREDSKVSQAQVITTHRRSNGVLAEGQEGVSGLQTPENVPGLREHRGGESFRR